MRTILFFLLATLLLAGCMRRDDERRRHLEDRIERLDSEITELRDENMRLRARVDALEAARGGESGASVPETPAPEIHARCVVQGDHYTLRAAEIDEVMANSAGLAREMRVVPFFDEGHSKGFKLFAIRPDTLVSSCGFHNGDVLEALNGSPLTNPDTALDAWAHTKTARSLDFRVIRNDAPLDLVIDRL